MKKIGAMGLVLLLGLLGSVSAQAGPVVNPGTYSTAQGDFSVQFWKEKFWGCSPEQPFSVLMATGKGFSLKRAALESIVSSDDPNWDWKSTYHCGSLILNSKGPWLKRGRLIAKNLIVTKYSRVDENNHLHFQMMISGAFENSEYSFQITAGFDGTPENYRAHYDEDGDPEFQMGSDLNMEIRIFKSSARPT